MIMKPSNYGHAGRRSIGFHRKLRLHFFASVGMFHVRATRRSGFKELSGAELNEGLAIGGSDLLSSRARPEMARESH